MDTGIGLVTAAAISSTDALVSWSNAFADDAIDEAPDLSEELEVKGQTMILLQRREEKLSCVPELMSCNKEAKEERNERLKLKSRVLSHHLLAQWSMRVMSALLRYYANGWLFQEEFVQQVLRIQRAGHSMSSDARIGEDLIVVATLERLISKKVSLPEVLALDVSKTVGLVPAGREDIKRNLAT